MHKALKQKQGQAMTQKFKLDIIFVQCKWENSFKIRSGTWLQLELECRVNFMPRGIFSNHSPVLVNLFKDLPNYPKSFKFHNMWTKHAEFKQITEEGWGTHVYGTTRYCFTKKLKTTQQWLKKPNTYEFSSVSLRTEEAKAPLEAAEKFLESNPTFENFWAVVRL